MAVDEERYSFDNFLAPERGKVARNSARVQEGRWYCDRP